MFGGVVEQTASRTNGRIAFLSGALIVRLFFLVLQRFGAGLKYVLQQAATC